MKKPVRGQGLRGGPGSDEDHDLWERTAVSVKPLRRKPRVHAAIETDDLGGAVVPPPAAKASKRYHAPYVPPPQTAPGRVPPLADFDERQARKIRSGRAEIERRVDLHGMRQSEAHSALRHFLLDCHAQGRRCVLVITGKGAPRQRRDGDEFGGWTDSEPGVLKRQVPRWLAEPELRAIVVSYTTAAVQHGGEGALYVHLRRPDRTR